MKARLAAALLFCVLVATADRAAAQSGSIYVEVPPPMGEAPLGGGAVVSRGWSVEAFWIGVAAALGVLTTGIVAVAADAPDGRISTGFGAGSMGILGIAAPTVTLGAGSARGHPYVPGAKGIRIAGWITFSLSLATGVGLLASDLEASNGRRGAFMAPVGFGAVSLLLFAFDALVGALQTDLVTGRSH
jgi:hypothetical protein